MSTEQKPRTSGRGAITDEQKREYAEAIKHALGMGYGPPMEGGWAKNAPEQERPTTNDARPINCDQVAWMLGAIERYLPPEVAPSVSRAREMKMYGLLYEIMEVANLHFEDDAAAYNGTPRDVKMRRYASKRDQVEKEGIRACNIASCATQRGHE